MENLVLNILIESLWTSGNSGKPWTNKRKTICKAIYNVIHSVCNLFAWESDWDLVFPPNLGWVNVGKGNQQKQESYFKNSSIWNILQMKNYSFVIKFQVIYNGFPRESWKYCLVNKPTSKGNISSDRRLFQLYCLLYNKTPNSYSQNNFKTPSSNSKEEHELKISNILYIPLTPENVWKIWLNLNMKRSKVCSLFV